MASQFPEEQHEANELPMVSCKMSASFLDHNYFDCLANLHLAFFQQTHLNMKFANFFNVSVIVIKTPSSVVGSLDPQTVPPDSA